MIEDCYTDAFWFDGYVGSVRDPLFNAAFTARMREWPARRGNMTER